MYSAFELDLGWVAPPDNPIHGFASSEQQEWVEEIRQAQGSDNFYKYGYVKGPLGQIVQVGVLANHIQALTDQFSYQTVVDDLATSAGIVYAAVIDTNRVNIAHSNPDRIGVTLNDDGTIAAAVRGERYAAEYFYEAGGVTVHDVLLPLIIDGQHVGAVNIGLSMENVYGAVREVLFAIVAIGILALILLGGILVAISLGIVNSLKATQVQLSSMAQGDFSTNLNPKYLNKQDELGEMARAVEHTQRAIRGVLNEMAQTCIVQ